MGNVVDEFITRVYDVVCTDRGGEVADYIPELAAVAPDGLVRRAPRPPVPGCSRRPRRPGRCTRRRTRG
ncbi:hypothetical protein GS464_14220 [Rhodococcus hoagii]|nr:hypothetical protein [Prescottella equi]